MKKFFALALCAVLLAGAAVGCAGRDNAAGKRISVVTTIFPVYDWIREIVRDVPGVGVTMLLDSGVDLHSYQPTADDIVKIADADLFVYVGGESDEWVEGVLRDADGVRSVGLIEALGDMVKNEELVEGMEGGEEEEPEPDEHVWLSLRCASALCGTLAERLGEADPEHREDYSRNARDYIEKLNALDAEYVSAVSSARVKTLLFGDRFPFRYLADDYGLDYYAAFSGCSAESEASFETVVFLADKIDSLGLRSIIMIEGSDGRIAGTVRDTTASKDQKILTLDSMQSVTASDVQNGETYLETMKKNLESLKEALK